MSESLIAFALIKMPPGWRDYLIGVYRATGMHAWADRLEADRG